MAAKMVETVGDVKQEFAVGRNPGGSVPDTPSKMEIDVEFGNKTGHLTGKRRVRLRDNIRRAVVTKKALIEIRGRVIIGEDERKGSELNIRKRNEFAREAKQRGTVNPRVARRESCHRKAGGHG